MKEFLMKMTGIHQVHDNARVVHARPAFATRGDAASTASATVSISASGKKLSVGESAATGDDSIASIMSGMSLRRIRYTELVAVADKLRDAGHLAEEDYLDFIGPSPEFSMVDGSRNPGWNAPVDVIGMHQTNLAFLSSIGAEQRFIDFEKRLIGLYHRFEA